MAQTGYTPIQLYYSTTTTNVPTAGNLADGELAINITDGKLFYKDNAGVVQTIATKNAVTNVASISFGSTGLTPSTATTGAVTVAGTLGVANGGTGAATLTGYVKGSGTSAMTASATIPTSDLTGTLGVANGGTGAATFTANTVLLGNGTSALQTVAPGTAGNVLTSSGGTWQSTALPANVSSISFGSTGLTPSTSTTGAVTVAGTLAAANGGTGVTSLGANIPTFLQTPSSANLAAAVTDETGSGALVFANSPTLGAFNATGNVNLDGGTFVFNDSGADLDARFEGDTDPNTIYLDASTNCVGFGTATPSARVHIAGTTGVPTNGGARFVLDATSTSAVQPPIFSFAKSSGTGSGTCFYGTTSWNPTKDDATTFEAASVYAGGDNRVATLSGSLYLTSYTNTIWNVSSVEKMRLTSAGNLKIGGSANRATTEGTNQIVLFNGTAPVGTLSNGVSIYSSSGEAYVMDASGNATLFSPHDSETNEWIFKSKHTPTGKVLRIDVEKLLRFVNEKFGLDAVHEFVEEN